MSKYKTVLITGASSGIGAALALLYAVPGVTLLLTGRNAARLEETAAACRAQGATVETCAACVTAQAAFTAQVEDWDTRHEIGLVIANAGISGGMGKPGGEDAAQFRAIMAINVDGVLNTVLPLVPRMRARGRGHIALMGSMAGFRGLPTAPAYSVSKNAVRALAEALRPLLKPHGVDVSLIAPGFIRTPLTDVNTFPMPFLMSVEKAAAKMKRGLDAGKPVIAFPFPVLLAMKFLTLLPRRVADWMVGRMPEKP